MHRRRRPIGRVMVQHDHVGRPGHRLQRRPGRSAAIDADDQRRPGADQAQQRRRVRAIALQHAVRHMGQHRAAEPAQQQRHDRRAAGAVHVVVAEHADGLAVRAPHARAGRRLHPCRPAPTGPAAARAASARGNAAPRRGRRRAPRAAGRRSPASPSRWAMPSPIRAIAVAQHPAPPGQARLNVHRVRAHSAEAAQSSLTSESAVTPAPRSWSRNCGAPRCSGPCRTCCASRWNA